MENKVKVSVLVPVYGVEKYIERCARSLFNQTMKEGIEFIFVNDATNDKSIEIVEKILDEYPERKNQVIIIHNKANQGIAETRHIALQAAHGEYVIHCDSDDWVEAEMYELMYNKAKSKDADIVGCDNWIVTNNKKILRRQIFSLNQNSILKELTYLKGLISGYLVIRLIRREFYIKGKYRADKGITMLEDLAISFPMHLNTNKVGYVNKPLYHYNKTNETSISTQLSPNSLQSAIKVLDKLISMNVSDKIKNNLIRRRNNFYLFYIDNYSQFNPSYFRENFAKYIPNEIVNSFKGSQKFRYHSVINNKDKITKISLFFSALIQVLINKTKLIFS